MTTCWSVQPGWASPAGSGAAGAGGATGCGGGTTAAGAGARGDIASTYQTELPLAGDVSALLDRLNLLLTYGQMSPALRTRISEAVSAIPIPGGTATPAQVSAAQLLRVKLAVFLTMASPEYLSQR